ncbi:hypothetical protein GGU11DRAFT_438188 [Lentinula aff. detonsa]|nr:hypothetical protein GGU11DRAFT_438188 [Lentinula aff. detonsa]
MSLITCLIQVVCSEFSNDLDYDDLNSLVHIIWTAANSHYHPPRGTMQTSLTTQAFRSFHGRTGLSYSRCRYSAPSARMPSVRFSHAAGGKDPRLSQGSAHKDNLHPNDPQSQSAQAGQSQKHSDSPLDAASSQRAPQKKARSGSGNPEPIGMVDQVGSQSSTAKKADGDGKTKN